MKKLFVVSLWMVVLVLAGNVRLQAAEGDTIVVLNERFDAFTEGSENAPGATDISGTGGKLQKNLPGWQGNRVYEAGGMLLVKGSLTTAKSDMSTHGGNVRITFRMKAVGGFGSMKVQVDNGTAQSFYQMGEGWQDIMLYVIDGKATSSVKFTPEYAFSGILIDDVKVETSDAFIAAPEALLSNDSDGKSFTARWKPVTNATAYLLDVFTVLDNDRPEYLVHDLEVAATTDNVQTMKVEGMKEGVTYYYKVRAKKGEYVSGYSEAMQVVKAISMLATPVATEATDVSEAGFTARWEAVADAEDYNVYLSKIEEMTEDREATVISEDFAKVTEGTVEYPQYLKTRLMLDQYTVTPGWYAELSCAAAGYIGLAPYGSSPALLCSPALDLSADNGKFSIKVKMKGYSYSGATTGDTVMVNVYHADKVVERIKVTLDDTLSDYVINGTKGAAETYVELEFLNGSHKLYIDEIAIVQDLRKGDVLKTMMSVTNVVGETSLRFDVPLSQTVRYGYTVVAHARTVVESYPDYEIGDIYSERSNEMIASVVIDNIESATAARFTVKGVQGGVVIESTSARPIYIYGMDGRLLKRLDAGAGSRFVNLPAGVVVVKAGQETRKLIVR